MARLVEFEPRFFPSIIQDAVSFMRIVAPEITDYEIGSRIRSILEAVATEQDEEYHQMVALLLLNDLGNNNGKDLDERLALLNLPRQRPISAVGEVIISNNNLPHSFLQSDIAAGATISTLYSSAPFPETGFPFTIRIGEGTSNVEDLTLSGNNISTKQLTHSATTKTHLKDERVSLVQGGTLNVIAGTRVRVRSAPDTAVELTATLLEEATIQSGDFDSQSILARADTPGTIGRYTKGAIRSFLASPPFDGALVRNDVAFGGGVDDESDFSYRTRGRNHPQSLARSIPQAIQDLVIGFTYLDGSGIEWRIVSAGIREVFRNNYDDLIYLYIWPGTFGFVEQDPAPTEVLTTSAEEGQMWFQISKYPLVPGTAVVQHRAFGSTTWITIASRVDYYLNEATGWLEYFGGLSKGEGLRLLRYDYYRGLIQRAQEFVDGSLLDKVNIRGVRAGGIKVLVTFPRPKKILDIRAAIQVIDGRESEVAPLVQDELSRYLSGLGVGEDVILNEMRERAMSVANMYDIKFIYPTSNISIQQDQILDLENIDIVIS